MTGETQRRAMVADFMAGVKFSALGRQHGISPSSVAKAIREELGGDPHLAREENCQDRISEVSRLSGRVFGLAPGAIWRGVRQKSHTHARYAAWLVCVEENIGLSTIGRAFEMDHSSVLYGRDQARNLVAKCPKFRAKLGELRTLVGSRIAEAA